MYGTPFKVSESGTVYDPFNPPDRIVHFTLVSFEEAGPAPLPDDQILCCKAGGLEPESSFDGEKWRSDVKSMVNCQECIEWMHA